MSPSLNEKIGKRTQAGTSLIELLVVIVVFLIGILAMAQIFPGGLRILSTTRNESIATTLSHAEMDWLRTVPDQMPAQIVPITYTIDGSGDLIGTITDGSVDNLGPEGPRITLSTAGQPAQWGVTGNTYDVLDSAGIDYGPWQYLSGANNVRHVIDEGKTVPAPTSAGSNYGSLLSLQFAPIVPIGPNNNPNVTLYGNDLVRTEGAPNGTLVDGSNNPQTVPTTGYYLKPGFSGPTYQYYWDDSTPSSPVLYIPEDPNAPGVTNAAHSYRISFIAYINTTSGLAQQSYVITTAPIPVIPSGFNLPNGQGCYYVEQAQSLLPGVSIVSIDFNTLRMARMYDYLPSGNAFDLTANADGTAHNPYQYKILNSSLGFILLNPLAYGYQEESANGSPVALRARADYDVFDWRILKEDFRIPETAPYIYQLKLSNIKHIDGYEPDLTFTEGIQTGISGGKTAVVIVDQQDDAIIAADSYSVDYHNGIINFKGAPSGWKEILPGTTSEIPITQPTNLNMRVYYEANGEWATQVLKSSANYQEVSSISTPLVPGEFYVSLPTSGTADNSTAIQFCQADIGQTIGFDEIWYQDSTGNVHVARGQSAVVKVIGGNPVVAITDIDPTATTLDFSNGYAVKGVKGLSVSVRVLWNPNTVKFQKAPANNMDVFNQFVAGWRNSTTEAILNRGVLQQ